MQNQTTSLTPTALNPGPPHARAWIITDGKTGMDVQARGVADALGVPYEMKQVTPRGVWGMAAPWGPVAPSERFGQPHAQFSPPWPRLAIATGRASIPYIRALRRHAGRSTYTVVLQDPKTPAGTADLIWVPAHDNRRGINVITTLTAPHSFTPSRLAQLRASVPPPIAALRSPRIAVILGGNNGVYTFSKADDGRFASALHALGQQGASFMITPSRRTHEGLIRAATAATVPFPHIVWDGSGENPYSQFLAHADALIVTADSVNMCGEACATGKPVFVFTPSGGSAKFARFHDGLCASGATRPLPATITAFEPWSYPPIDSAGTIAAEIRARWRP